ncbi:hypothetical protein CROQUDRAFT_93739 [Cronartium quercuum f. sp. fusiforme G11]|uniref:Secreted protein n=1 Tax=Cronartium quercuum f. sp. fusiforme G11 TaxID=708437 RepID=A0A9P6NJW1_9BASI|nr:hypothetical protein CROQUDRAFT_93739 [Cronartium quercuum f. sp. fusiforme G11]
MKYQLLALIVLVFLACEPAKADSYFECNLPTYNDAFCANDANDPKPHQVSALNSDLPHCFTCDGQGKLHAYCRKKANDELKQVDVHRGSCQPEA